MVVGVGSRVSIAVLLGGVIGSPPHGWYVEHSSELVVKDVEEVGRFWNEIFYDRIHRLILELLTLSF
ncbi:MAG: hypothetical protein HQ591_05995 [candidate division Zixibacteria bacterium]|nr:hypothetical protein [Candidatus Tariuqbacter arcticus]